MKVGRRKSVHFKARHFSSLVEGNVREAVGEIEQARGRSKVMCMFGGTMAGKSHVVFQAPKLLYLQLHVILGHSVCAVKLFNCCCNMLCVLLSSACVLRLSSFLS